MIHLMTLLVASTILAGAALAEENLLAPGRPSPPKGGERAVRPAVPAEKSEIDALFLKLASAKTPAEAHPTEQRILARWNQSGSATVDLFMGWAEQAIGSKNFTRALDLLDQVTVMKPDFAEGYNRRATVYYLTDDYQRSLADIQTTLALEPRHFGALTGLGAILTEMGDSVRAGQIFRKALAINPQLNSAREALEKIEKTEQGSPI